VTAEQPWCGTVTEAAVCTLPAGHAGAHVLEQPPQAKPEPRQDARVVELARKVAPATVDDYEAARREMLALADAFGRCMVGSEEQACHWARGVAGNVVRAARAFAVARKALVKAAQGPVIVCSDR
jgi:hypothetical protein